MAKPRGPKPKNFKPGSPKGGQVMTKNGWVIDKQTGQRVFRKRK